MLKCLDARARVFFFFFNHQTLKELLRVVGGRGVMSRRQRSAKKGRSRPSCPGQVLRRRARGVGSTRAATAATAAAITLAGVAASADTRPPAPGRRRSRKQQGPPAPRQRDAPITRSPLQRTLRVRRGGWHRVLHRRRRRPRPASCGADGTKAGTLLVKDIKRGTFYDSYYQLTFPSSSHSVLPDRVGGALFFTANDGIHGDELWKSDGTKAGTVLVKRHQPHSWQLRPLLFIVAGRKAVLHRERRHPRRGAVEVGRHQGRHRPGQGHQPRYWPRAPRRTR